MPQYRWRQARLKKALADALRRADAKAIAAAGQPDLTQDRRQRDRHPGRLLAELSALQ